MEKRGSGGNRLRHAGLGLARGRARVASRPAMRRARRMEAELGRGMRGDIKRRLGKSTRAPCHEKLLQLAEQARQAGHDEGLHGVRQPAARLVRLCGDAQGGELAGQ